MKSFLENEKLQLIDPLIVWLIWRLVYSSLSPIEIEVEMRILPLSSRDDSITTEIIKPVLPADLERFSWLFLKIFLWREQKGAGVARWWWDGVHCEECSDRCVLRHLPLPWSSGRSLLYPGVATPQYELRVSTKQSTVSPSSSLLSLSPSSPMVCPWLGPRVPWPCPTPPCSPVTCPCQTVVSVLFSPCRALVARGPLAQAGTVSALELALQVTHTERVSLLIQWKGLVL